MCVRSLIEVPAGLRIDSQSTPHGPAESEGRRQEDALRQPMHRGRGKKSLPCNAKAKEPSEEEEEGEEGKLRIWIRGAAIWCRAFWVV